MNDILPLQEQNSFYRRLDISDPFSIICKIIQTWRREKVVLFHIKGAEFITYHKWGETSLGRGALMEITGDEYKQHKKRIFLQSLPTPERTEDIIRKMKPVLDYLFEKDYQENVTTFANCRLCGVICSLQFLDTKFQQINAHSKLCSYCQVDG